MHDYMLQSARCQYNYAAAWQQLLVHMWFATHSTAGMPWLFIGDCCVGGAPTRHAFLPGCRYVVRAQASDMLGGWNNKDFELLVRKVGDPQARAPCCRYCRQILHHDLIAVLVGLFTQTRVAITAFTTSLPPGNCCNDIPSRVWAATGGTTALQHISKGGWRLGPRTKGKVSTCVISHSYRICPRHTSATPTILLTGQQHK